MKARRTQRRAMKKWRVGWEERRRMGSQALEKGGWGDGHAPERGGPRAKKITAGARSGTGGPYRTPDEDLFQDYDCFAAVVPFFHPNFRVLFKHVAAIIQQNQPR